MIKKLVAPKTEAEIKSSWKYTDKIYISCVCMTYNQESYIRDTIDGFLAQETDYKYEIIIHDDASTDNTKKILLSYKKKYPSIIRLILQDKNQYSSGGSVMKCAIQPALGEYVAFCEGDDFWIDSSKIQYQIKKFIDSDKVSLVHSNCIDYIVEENLSLVSDIPKEINDFNSLLRLNGIRTLTTMFKKSDYLNYINLFSEFFYNWKLGDWPMWLYFSSIGNIVKVDRMTGVYRILRKSASHFSDIHDEYHFILSTIQVRENVSNRLNNTEIRKYNFYNELVRFSIKNDFKIEDPKLSNCSMFYRLIHKVFFLIPKNFRVKIIENLKQLCH